MRLKILSWNIWIDGHFHLISNFLKHADFDIIGLQEVKDSDPERDIIGYLMSLGYQHVFAPVKKEWGGKVYNDGPAIFSKYPIQKSEIYSLSEKNTRVAVRADIQVKDTLLHVVNTHLLHTHQKDSDEQSKQADTLLSVIPQKRCIVMGDFNATPQSAVIQKMKAQLLDADSSSISTWSVYPEGCITCNPQNIATKLDYIFTSKDINTQAFEVGNSRGSDHLPITVVIDL